MLESRTMPSHVDPTSNTTIRRPTLILASNSPRRRELLALGGWSFEAQAADVDEDPREGEAPPDYVLRLAQEKAHAVGRDMTGDAVVLAADTTVVLDGRILGKPADAAEAEQMLGELRGLSHQVFTGLALLRTATGEMITDLAESQVPMRDYSPAEMAAYIASGDPFDKAGGYAIQNGQFNPVADFNHCYANVMGLPLCHLQRSLEMWGLAFEEDISANCQTHIEYNCPVYETILTWKQ